MREQCGYFLLDSWSLVRVSGKDIFTFLQTQTTNDILKLELGEGQNSAIVDRKGRLVAPFSIHRDKEESVLFLIETSAREHCVNHLEHFLFREDVKLETPAGALLALQGPMSTLVLEQCGREITLPQKTNAITTFTFEGEEVGVINKSLTGEEGFIVCLSRPLLEKWTDRLLEINAPCTPSPIGSETFDVLRLEAGLPLFDKDMSQKNVLPETGLEHTSVSYNKGCYIGQEVIARIKTYGAPNVALMGLVLENGVLPPFDSDIILGSKKIGTLKSATHSPSLGKFIALAYIQKEHRSPDVEMEVTLAGQPCKIRTFLLPFYQTQTRKDHSKRLLDQALKIYKNEEQLDTPITLLRDAIALDPKNAAAYEALGVLLSKQGDLDEAIALMKRLVEIDPNEIMAHTNLSVYYMKQGRIEEAEQEKGEATAIEFERIVAQSMAKKSNLKKVEEEKKERERKIEMFRKVLEIDPVDQVANFGLGSIFLETERYEEALKPLQTVIAENKDYSAAYLLLGKNLEKLSRYQEAIEVYRQGIAAASKKGDLMPLKEMQSRLNQLLHSDS